MIELRGTEREVVLLLSKLAKSLAQHSTTQHKTAYSDDIFLAHRRTVALGKVSGCTVRGCVHRQR
jgi:hypothetical protein